MINMEEKRSRVETMQRGIYWGVWESEKTALDSPALAPRASKPQDSTRRLPSLPRHHMSVSSCDASFLHNNTNGPAVLLNTAQYS